VITPALPSEGALETRLVTAPRREPFDTIRVVPSGGDSRYSIGHLRFVAEAGA